MSNLLNKYGYLILQEGTKLYHCTNKKLNINHSTNYAACELLGIDYEKRNLNDEEILKAKIELKKRMEPLTKEAHNLLLDQYSNSVL